MKLSREVSAAQAEREFALAWVVAIQSVWEDQVTADIMMRGFQELEALSSQERGVFHGKVGGLVSLHSVLRQMFQRGLIQAEMMRASDNEIAKVLNSPGGRRWWSDLGPFYPHYDYVEALRAAAANESTVADVDIYKPLPLPRTHVAG